MDDQKDITLIVAGSADAGKSTFIGVMSKYISLIHGYAPKNADINYLDDGNGRMRSTVANFTHEIESGKTSSVAYNTLICNNKISLVDLCGQQKYLKTTISGITSSNADYAILVVAANRGFVDMTIEHLIMILMLKIPFMILITRVDLVQDMEQYNNIIKFAVKNIQRKSTRTIYNPIKFDLTTNLNDDSFDENLVFQTIDMMKNNKIPIINISNTTGYNIKFMKSIFDNLAIRNRNPDFYDKKEGSIFYIDHTYQVDGIGIVVSGYLRGAPIKKSSILSLGPYCKGFIDVRVFSIHDNMRNEIDTLYDRQRGCLAIKLVTKLDHFTRKNIKKGMVLLTKNIISNERNICKEFRCDMQVACSDRTTVSVNNGSCLIVNCGSIKQDAKIIFDKYTTNSKKETNIMTLTKGVLYNNVKVVFNYKGEFIEKGAEIIFRESNVNAKGIITEIVPLTK